MTDYKECGSVVINGKKRVLYSKPGSTKKYVTYKGRKMNVIKYRKMIANKAPKMLKKPKMHKRKHAKRHGGEGSEEKSNLMNLINLGNI